jgi:hypothetical protein
VSETIDEEFAIEAAEPVLLGELAEDLRPVGLDVLRQAEEIGLGQHHGPQLARPLVKPHEEIAVEGL